MSTVDDTIGNGEEQPRELGALKQVVEEFMKRFNTIKQEQELLKEDEKALVEEFSTKLDMKTLKAAMRVADITKKVKHKDTFDELVTVLDTIG